jgi:hypothetical protein
LTITGLKFKSPRVTVKYTVGRATRYTTSQPAPSDATSNHVVGRLYVVVVTFLKSAAVTCSISGNFTSASRFVAFSGSGIAVESCSGTGFASAAQSASVSVE